MIASWTAVAALLAAVTGWAPAPVAPEVQPDGAVRVVHGSAGDAAHDLLVTLDGRAAGAAAWGAASDWQVVSAGPHRVEVGGRYAGVGLDVPAGCRVTVLAAVRDGVPTLLPSSDCIAERIPTGSARLTTVLVADPDLGPVEARVGAVRQLVHPFEPVPAHDVPAGATQLAIGAPGSAETYSRVEAELVSGTAYTLVWVGGGETPPRLAVVVDAAQAPDPPPPGSVINTGDAEGTGWQVAVAVVFLLLAAFRSRSRVACAVLTAGVLLSGCTATTVEPAPPPPGGSAAPVVPPTVAPGAAVPGIARIRIDAIGLDRSVGELSTGAVSELPQVLPREAVAWVTGSTPMGAPGTTALLGHSTTAGGGAFARLGELAAGDVVTVADGAGRELRYEVRVSVSVAKTRFPGEVWAPQPVSTLLLITCTGASGGSRGQPDNRLVRAVLVAG